MNFAANAFIATIGATIAVITQAAVFPFDFISRSHSFPPAKYKKSTPFRECFLYCVVRMLLWYVHWLCVCRDVEFLSHLCSYVRRV